MGPILRGAESGLLHVTIGISAMLGPLKVVLSIGIVTMLVGPAMAQAPVGQGGFLGVPVTLLGVPSVQKELKLDESQIQKSKELIEATRQRSLGLRDQLANIPVPERRAKQALLLKTMNEESLKNATAFLKPEQFTRLLQIELQQRGFNAFYDLAITTKLGFTDEQNGKVKSIIDTDREDGVRALQKGAAEDRQAGMQKAMALRQETLLKIIGVMTDDQKKTWKGMLGEPFEIGPRPGNTR
jgi:hypothetical protein